MRERKLIVKNKSEMEDFARDLASSHKLGSIYALTGDLGAGKTFFVKAFLKSLGINEDVTSPTFNIVKTYKINDVSINHFDVYRIKDATELVDIGYYEYINDENSISLIEWADIIKDEVPSATWIDIKIIDSDKREISVKES